MESNPQSTDEQLAQSAWVRRLAQSMLRDPGLAEDAAQESAIAAWRRGPIDASSRASWLATTVRRFAGRLVRGEARRSTRERSVARSEALPSAAELVERAEAHRALVAAVLALDEPYRSTVLLRYVEDLPPRAIARRAGIPVATVKTRLARGLEKLRRDLESKHGDAREWLGLVVPFVPAAHAPPLVLGASLVKTLKLALVALVLLALGVGMLHILRPVQEPLRDLAAAAPPAAPQVAVEPAIEGGGASGSRAGLATLPEAPHGASALPEREMLRGRVLDLREQPIAGATVRALHSPSDGYYLFDGEMREEAIELAREVSDAEGRFSLDLPYGLLVGLDADASGFAPEHLDGKFGGGELVIHLGACGVLTGDVLREDGSPVVDALVRVNAGVEDGIERLLRTDAAGRYRATDLQPGKIGVIVVPERDALTRWEELELRPGEVLRHDVRVQTGASLRGRVLDAATRAPIVGAEISANNFVYKTVRSDAHGEFEIGGLPARQLQLAARARGYGRTDVRAFDTQSAVEVLLRAGRGAHGRVVGADGQGIPGAFVAALAIGVVDDAGRRDIRSALSRGNGCFELTDLSADLPHTLFARAPGHGASLRAFPADESLQGSVDLGEIVLDASAFVEGRVLGGSGKALAGLTIAMKPVVEPALRALADLNGSLSVSSDLAGRFVFRDLAPGDWVLSARAEGLPAQEDVTLHLAAGEAHRGLELRLGDSLAIEGLVADERGHALSDALVRASSERGSGSAVWQVTAADGAFVLRGLKPGSYTIDVRGPHAETECYGRFDSLQQRNVEAGTAGLQLRLVERTSSIGGRVLDADGAPLAGAFVWRMGESQPLHEFVLTDAEGRFSLALPPGRSTQLCAQRGVPLIQAKDAPTSSEYFAGRVLVDDPGTVAVSKDLQAGVTGVELRLRAPR